MELRRLEPQDAPFMLEWMHDADAVAYMQADFADMTLQDCERFIRDAAETDKNLHCAIADADGVYQGTVSLKQIDSVRREAEFAIAIRRGAMGHGVSSFGMNEILECGFSKLGLRRIYWCVSEKNARARRFYQKQGYKPVRLTPDQNGLLWYEAFAPEEERKNNATQSQRSDLVL